MSFSKYLKKWLWRHQSQFPCKPFLKRDRQNGSLLKFQSLPFIEIKIDDEGLLDVWVRVVVKNEQEYYDNLFDATPNIQHHTKGYYCTFCIEKKYFKTKEQIWDEHLKQFLSWAKNNITKETIPKLIIFDEYGSYEIKLHRQKKV
jgi:hypothetical protein